MLQIIPGDFADPRVVALLDYHHRTMHAQTPKGSAHALDLAGLQSPALSLWTIWSGDFLAGMGALKTLSPAEGEVKSMRTVEGSLRKGIGGVMLRHIIEAARERGMRRISLETGGSAPFAPAIAFYRAHGFTDCAPFADYRPDPHSVFMTLEL